MGGTLPLRSSLRRDSSGASSLSLKTGSLSGWDAIRASLSSQNNRSRRGGLPRKHKSSKRLRESSTKAVKDARGGAAVKSRSSLGFQCVRNLLPSCWKELGGTAPL